MQNRVHTPAISRAGRIAGQWPDIGARAGNGATACCGLLALQFTRDTNAVDVTYVVEGGYALTNGAEWVGIATNSSGSWGGATNVTEGLGSPASVTAFDVVPAATNRFLRLRVSRP